MIQSSIIHDKKYCGKRINQYQKGQVNFLDIERPQGGNCSNGTRICGGGDAAICLNETNSCPINKLEVIVKRTQAQIYIDQAKTVKDMYLPFGDAHELKFSNYSKEPMISSIQLEISKPCLKSYYF